MNKHARSAGTIMMCAVCYLMLMACQATNGNQAENGNGVGMTGGALRSFNPPPSKSVNNSVLVTVTGEGFSSNGLAFPPTAANSALYFVDGWEITFNHVIVEVDNITISENPDFNPNDVSQTGDPVARVQGPWAIDLAKVGPLSAKEMNGTAFPLARISKQNLKAQNPAFNSNEKYAFGYELIPARAGTYNVNLDTAGEAAWHNMVSNKWSVWLSGSASWKGHLSTPACRSTDSGYDFTRFPKTVQFSFGFHLPVAFKNCENPELNPTGSRGIQTQALSEIQAQLTLHLDHLFWEALEEDAPLRFDAIAAQKSVATGMTEEATTSINQSDIVGVDFQLLKDAQGMPIPWRTCAQMLSGERSRGSVAYDPLTVPVNPAGGTAGLKDFYDYMTYNLSTFGHLNNDGLCFPVRKYPSPF